MTPARVRRAPRPASAALVGTLVAPAAALAAVWATTLAGPIPAAAAAGRAAAAAPMRAPIGPTSGDEAGGVAVAAAPRDAAARLDAHAQLDGTGTARRSAGTPPHGVDGGAPPSGGQVPAASLPGAGSGRAGGSGHGRRIALIDAPEAVRQLQWEFDHPRDTDTSPGHRLTVAALVPLSLAARGATALLGAAGWLVRGLLGALGPAGAPLAAAGHLLGTSFDGRGLNALLTDGLLDGLVGPLSRRGAHVPVLGWLVRAERAAVSFGVGVLTGVDQSDHDTVGGVLLALACDLLVLARPLGLAGRLALDGWPRLAAGRLQPAAQALRRALDLSSRAGDVLGGRPSALLRLVGRTQRHRRLHDALDTASLVLRPSALPGHLMETSGRLAAWARVADSRAATGSAAERALAAALHHLSQEQRAALTGVALGQVEDLAELSHLHSGARTLSAVAGGHLQPFGGDPPPRIRLTVPSR
jgi:hypothetical protein